MVVVHQQHILLGEDGGGGIDGSPESGHVFLALGKAVGGAADADVLTAEGLVGSGGFGGIVPDLVHGVVGDDTAQAVCIQLLFQPVGFVGAGAGDLDGLIADIGHTLQGFCEAGEVLAVIAQSKKLCTKFHKSVLLISILRVVAFIIALQGGKTSSFFIIEDKKRAL